MIEQAQELGIDISKGPMAKAPKQDKAKYGRLINGMTKRLDAVERSMTSVNIHTNQNIALKKAAASDLNQ